MLSLVADSFLWFGYKVSPLITVVSLILLRSVMQAGVIIGMHPVSMVTWTVLLTYTMLCLNVQVAGAGG